MSEFSFSSPNTTANSKKTHYYFYLSSLLLSDLFFLCSFIISHPLYLSYFIFFSLFIIKILSFLSPLFITTSLLLLALFTTFLHDNLCSNADNENQDFRGFEELEAYKILFDTSILESRESSVQDSEENCLQTFEEAPVDKYSIQETRGTNVSYKLTSNIKESLAENLQAESNEVIVEAKIKGGFLEEGHVFVDATCEKDEKEVNVKPLSEEFNKGDNQEHKEAAGRGGSKAIGSKVSDDNGEEENLSKVRASFQIGGSHDNDGGKYYTSKVMDINYSQPLMSGSNLGSFGSMRKEKEWRRTLACKLFEERHNVEGYEEGMDSLWETYETNAIKLQSRSKSKKGKQGSNKYYGDDDDDDDDEEEEDEIDDGQLCCLKALKFSAGKMNLGMGRPNLVKFSKAIKGIGWLHHVSKHGKKIRH